MARKDGTPRVIPNLSDLRDETVVLLTDKVRVAVAHTRGERYVTVSTRTLAVTLNETEADELAQAMLDAREDIRR